MTEDTSLREKALRAMLRAELRKWPDNADISIDGLYVITAGELAGILDASEAKDRRIEALEAALTELAEYVDGYHFASERGRVARLVFSARAALSGKEGQS